MTYLPIAILTGLIGYAFFGMFTGKSVDFPLILFLAVVISGIAWALDKWVWSKKRAPGEVAPSHIDTPASIFPVLLVVFLLRSFVAEPFRIPSSSMRPTLEVGDFILVNKFKYGIRLPVIDKKILDTGAPGRGDVVVFRYPVNQTDDYIKRIVGVPGDVVTYKNKQLTVNNVPATQTSTGTYGYVAEESGRFITHQRASEMLGTVKHDIAMDASAPTLNPPSVFSYVGKENCEYFGSEGFTCKVPANSYLVLGDNRDNSLDGRYWGFVPDANLRGKAFFIWFNWADFISFNFKRIGSSIQ
jgi:signal peptidase I